MGYDGSESDARAHFTRTRQAPPAKPGSTRESVHDALARMVEAAGIKKAFSCHKLRHTAATHMAAPGVPLAVLKDVLGHSQINLTANTYSHAVPAAVKSATDALEKAYLGSREWRR